MAGEELGLAVVLVSGTAGLLAGPGVLLADVAGVVFRVLRCCGSVGILWVTTEGREKDALRVAVQEGKAKEAGSPQAEPPGYGWG